MGLELWLVVGRAACLFFAAIALPLIIKAPNMINLSSFMFLGVALSVQMVWSAIRFLFQIKRLWFGQAQQPSSNTTLIVLIVLELVLTTTTMAAGCSALGATVLLDLDLGDCKNFSPSACPMYFLSSSLAIFIGVLEFLITLGMQWVLSFHYHCNTIPA